MDGRINSDAIRINNPVQTSKTELPVSKQTARVHSLATQKDLSGPQQSQTTDVHKSVTDLTSNRKGSIHRDMRQAPPPPLVPPSYPKLTEKPAAPPPRPGSTNAHLAAQARLPPSTPKPISTPPLDLPRTRSASELSTREQPSEIKVRSQTLPNLSSRAAPRPLSSQSPPPPLTVLGKDYISPNYQKAKKELFQTEWNFSQKMVATKTIFDNVKSSASGDLSKLNDQMSRDYGELADLSRGIAVRFNSAISAKDIHDVYNSPEMEEYFNKLDSINVNFTKYNTSLTEHLRENPDLGDKINAELAKTQSNDLSSLLIEPIQRGPRHILLLRELNKLKGNDPEFTAATNIVDKFMSSINAKMRAMAEKEEKPVVRVQPRPVEAAPVQETPPPPQQLAKVGMMSRVFKRIWG